MLLGALLLVAGLFMLWQGDAKRSYAKEFGGATALFGLGFVCFGLGSALLVLLGLVSMVGAAAIYFTIYSKRKNKAIGR